MSLSKQLNRDDGGCTRAIEIEIKFVRPGLLALLYGRIHRSVKKFSRDPPDRAARAPHAMHHAVPGASALAAAEHCTRTRLHALYLAWTC